MKKMFDKLKEIKMEKETKAAAIEILNRVMAHELAGVARYTHYSLMVYGFNRIPIIDWMREQARESLTHAEEAGEMITWLGAHPELGVGPLLESNKHDLSDILRESLDFEREALSSYHELHDLVAGQSVYLEEYAHTHIVDEESHADQVNKMLRKPGDVEAV
jgi:bacterioferritin